MVITTVPSSSIGILSSRMSIPYPFLNKVSDPSGLENLVVDFYLLHENDSVYPALLNYLHVDVSGSSYNIKIRDTDYTMLFDSTTGSVISKYSSYGRWSVIEWIKGTEVCRITLVTDRISDFSFPLSPAGARLTDSTFYRRPLRVNKLVTPLWDFTDEIQLSSGYNAEVALSGQTKGGRIALPEIPFEDTDEVRDPTKVEFTAETGAGLGVYKEPCSGVTQPLITINGQSTVDGDMRIIPKDCYWIERPSLYSGGNALVVDHALKLHNDCGPCCDCEDYVKTYLALQGLWNRAKNMSNTLQALRTTYNRLRAEWMAQKATREIGLKAVVKIIPKPGFGLLVMGMATNSQPCDVKGPIRFYFSASPSIAMLGLYSDKSGLFTSDGAGTVQVDPGGIWAHTWIVTTTEDLAGTRWMRYTFGLELRNDDEGVSRLGSTIAINLAVQGTISGSDTVTSASAISETVELLPPLQKE